MSLQSQSLITTASSRIKSSVYILIVVQVFLGVAGLLLLALFPFSSSVWVTLSTSLIILLFFLSAFFLFFSSRKLIEHERKSADTAMWLSTLIDSMPDLVCFKDGQGRWLEANEFDLELFELTDVDYRGKKDSDLAEYSPYFKDAFLYCEATDEEAWNAGGMSRTDETITKPDGTELVFDVIKVPIFNEDGSRRMLVVVGRDITTKKQLEKQLYTSQKMEALALMTGGIAHDFNNLLTVILGNCQLALTSSKSTAQNSASHISKIQKAGLRAKELTGKLLAFGQKQILQIESIDLDGALEEMRSLIETALHENIELQITSQPNTYCILADTGQLSQVLLNLALNAKDAMPDGGQLQISLAQETLSQDDLNTRQLTRIKPGPYISISVSDTGKGMEEATLEHLFEPFFTTKGPGKGTGLGLATSLGIIEQHNGGITVESTQGKGTTITLFFPENKGSGKSPSHQSNNLEPGQPSDTPAPSSNKILLVEDDSQVREVIEELLINNGYNVITFSSPEDALEWQREHEREKISLLITDVVMPKHSGPELVGLLAEAGCKPPVILLSGYTQDIQGVAALKHQGAIFIRKPFGFEHFLRCVYHSLQPADGSASKVSREALH